MKRVFSVLLLGAVFAVLLTACSSVPVRNAYTATGDGTKPSDLKQTNVFTSNEDLNVVVNLNAHNRPLAVSAIFTAPNGDVINTDTLDADETVPAVVLGLDWQAQGTTPWQTGDWKVDVYVDEVREKELHFTVNAPQFTPPG